MAKRARDFASRSTKRTPSTSGADRADWIRPKLTKEQAEALRCAKALLASFAELNARVAQIPSSAFGEKTRDAMHAALDLAGNSAAALQAYIEHGDNWPVMQDELVRAARVLHGGRADHPVIGETYQGCVDSLNMWLWAVNPPLSHHVVASELRTLLVEMFGVGFERLDCHQLAYRIEHVRLSVERDRRKFVGEGRTDEIHDVRKRRAINLIAAVIWLVHEERRMASLPLTGVEFRCPLPWQLAPGQHDASKPSLTAISRMIRDKLRAGAARV